MSSEVERLAQEVRVTQELLFLVLDYLGQPVILDIEEAKKRMQSDRRIDLDLDEEAGTWTLSVVDNV